MTEVGEYFSHNEMSAKVNLRDYTDFFVRVDMMQVCYPGLSWQVWFAQHVADNALEHSYHWDAWELVH